MNVTIADEELSPVAPDSETVRQVAQSLSIAIAIVIEGGTSGSGDAAPLGRRMIEMCNELGYVGTNIAGEYAEVNSTQDR